jgi:hypothetical protein
MKVFRKYQFGSKSAATAKINALGIDEEGNPTHNNAIVRLGNLVVTPAEIDAEGNVITEAVLTDTYHVDVLWDGEPNPDWDAQMVWCPPMGVHTFGSSSAIAEWTEKCKELHPEYFPEPELETI